LEQSRIKPISAGVNRACSQQYFGERASKLPGAVVATNPYVAGAKFVFQKDTTERDIAKTAEQFIQEILKFEQQIREETPSDSR